VDVLNDLVRGQVLLVSGLLVYAIVFVAAASWLLGHAVWQASAWREPVNHTAETGEVAL
jgi:hypothetical protein